MTAIQVIRQLEKLSARERRKVFAYVGSTFGRREEIEDRKAVKEVRRDLRQAVPWKEVKRRIGLSAYDEKELLADPAFRRHLARMKAGEVRYYDANTVPAVRNLSKTQIKRWIARDEEGMAAFRATPRKTKR